MNKFWMVIRSNGDGGTFHIHTHYDKALEEATRLCCKENRAFVILQATELFEPQTPPVKQTKLE